MSHELANELDFARITQDMRETLRTLWPVVDRAMPAILCAGLRAI